MYKKIEFGNRRNFDIHFTRPLWGWRNPSARWKSNDKGTAYCTAGPFMFVWWQAKTWSEEHQEYRV